MNAEKKDDDDIDEEEEDVEEAFEVVPSDLGPETHAEMGLLYNESTNAILFAKTMQWKTVGATLLIYIALIAIAAFVSKDRVFVNYLEAIVFVVAPAAIFIIAIYQFWQHTELEKLRVIEPNFSNLFREVRKIKSRAEANIHRYILFFLMIAVIVLGGVITYISFLKLK